MPNLAIFDQGPLPKNPVFSGTQMGKRVKTQPPGRCSKCGAKLSIYRPLGETECASHPKVHVPRIKKAYKPIPKQKGLMVNSFQKEAIEVVQKHGYEVAGEHKGVVWMEHAHGGRLAIHASPRNKSVELGKLDQRARKMVAHSNQNMSMFVSYLRKKYQVPNDSSVVVQTAIAQEVRKWLATKEFISGVGSSPPSINAIRIAIVRNGFVVVHKQGQGKNPSTIEILGKNYVPDEKAKPPTNADKAEQVEAATKSEPICGESHPTYPGVWCTDTPGHIGMHTSEAVESGWYTAKDEPTPEPTPMLHPGVAIKEPIAATVGEPVPAGRVTVTLEPPVGVPGTEPVVDESTKPTTVEKTPTGGDVVVPAELATLLRQMVAPNAYTNEQTLIKCKELVKTFKTQLDSAYEILYTLERLLGE